MLKVILICLVIFSLAVPLFAQVDTAWVRRYNLMNRQDRPRPKLFAKLNYRLALMAMAVLPLLFQCAPKPVFVGETAGPYAVSLAVSLVEAKVVVVVRSEDCDLGQEIMQALDSLGISSRVIIYPPNRLKKQDKVAAFAAKVYATKLIIVNRSRVESGTYTHEQAPTTFTTGYGPVSYGGGSVTETVYREYWVITACDSIGKPRQIWLHKKFQNAVNIEWDDRRPPSSSAGSYDPSAQDRWNRWHEIVKALKDAITH
jgi:hypothetical protein